MSSKRFNNRTEIAAAHKEIEIIGRQLDIYRSQQKEIVDLTKEVSSLQDSKECLTKVVRSLEDQELKESNILSDIQSNKEILEEEIKILNKELLLIKKSCEKEQLEHKKILISVQDELDLIQHSKETVQGEIKAHEATLETLKQEIANAHIALPKLPINHQDLLDKIDKLSQQEAKQRVTVTELTQDIEDLKQTAREYDIKAELSINNYIKNVRI